MEKFYTSIIGSLTIQLLLPALMLIVLLLLMLYVLFAAQRRADFDLANMLRGDDGRESAARLCILGAFAISSWALMTEVLSARVTSDLWWGYLFTWSGALVFLKVAEKWNGVLPFAKTPPQPSQE